MDYKCQIKFVWKVFNLRNGYDFANFNNGS